MLRLVRYIYVILGRKGTVDEFMSCIVRSIHGCPQTKLLADRMVTLRMNRHNLESMQTPSYIAGANSNNANEDKI